MGFRSGSDPIIRLESPPFTETLWQKNQSKSKALPIHILNGPNLNLLGSREPEIYGTATLAEIEKACAGAGQGHGFAIVFNQSNKEGELVELIQAARGTASAVIINAAAYTHTSVAVLDALKMLEIPVIEVHLSNPARREDFRHKSYVAMGATGTITGLGLNSYLLAIDAVAAIFKEKRQGQDIMSDDKSEAGRQESRASTPMRCANCRRC